MKLPGFIKNLPSKISLAFGTAVLFFSGLLTKVYAQAKSDSPTAPEGLKNPLKIDTLAAFVQKVLEIVMTIGIPIVAIFIIYSGFLFVKARGNPEELKTAKQTFLWTVVGAAILLASWILAKAICTTVIQLGNTTTQCK